MPDTGVRKELEINRSRLEQIVMVSHNEIFLFDDQSLFIQFANTAALKNLGYNIEELKTLKFTDLFSFPDEMAMHALLKSVRTGRSERLNLQLKFLRKTGGYYDADAFIQVLETDHVWLVVATDITHKLNTERRLLDTIYEKETLIKEIHHRVKNNLQLISSIIFLKLASVTQDDIKGFLEDTRQKIRSIALIHERLLQTESLDKVEISDYLGKLMHDLEVTYYREDLSLQMEKKIQNVFIGLDTAIICGLIVNELVTNAMKHAFSGRKSGCIEIGFEKTAEGYQLWVQDDGVSLPPHLAPGQSSSFGMQLIDIFVKQLNGVLEIHRNKGTLFLIRF